jgi:hypothetical protein
MGVMLALAADRWQQSRNEDGLTGAYIDRLIADLDTDLAAYRGITEWSDVIDEAATFGVEVYRGREVTTVDYERFVVAILQSSWLQRGGETSATYIDLISTGNFSLLSLEVRGPVSDYYAQKEMYLVGRSATFVERLSRGYWNVPSLILGPDLLPRVWLSIQGRERGYLPAQGSLGLTESDIGAVIERLRGIEDFEKQAADVRFFMTQRKIIYGERLPQNAHQLKALLKLAQ